MILLHLIFRKSCPLVDMKIYHVRYPVSTLLMIISNCIIIQIDVRETYQMFSFLKLDICKYSSIGDNIESKLA